MLTKNIILHNIHRVKRPGLGYVYKGTISVAELARALRDGDIAYSLKYQRGTKKDVTFEPDALLSLFDDKLEIKPSRAQQMAAKYLIALAGKGTYALYNPDIIWNARREDGVSNPDYDPKEHELRIHSRISIPDSAHRHFAYFLVALWKSKPDQIPDRVYLDDEKIESIERDEIEHLLVDFDPSDVEETSAFVEIFNLTKEEEGKLFVEYNELGKKPSTAASIDMYESRSPGTRFVARLMEVSSIFARSEIETRSNTIGSKSRKLTTNATLVSAVKPYAKKLRELEDKKDSYNNLVIFVSSFYEEWSHHFKEFEPTASEKDRSRLRETSFALTNILFFPMLRLAFEMWFRYQEAGLNWREEKGWKDALSRLAGNTEVDGVKYAIMARDYRGDKEQGVPAVNGNPEWRGKILIETFDSTGKSTGWSLSSTRQTRDSAYHYLLEKSRFKFPAPASSRAA